MDYNPGPQKQNSKINKIMPVEHELASSVSSSSMSSVELSNQDDDKDIGLKMNSLNESQFMSEREVDMFKSD
jgi:hypothetical protein